MSQLEFNKTNFTTLADAQAYQYDTEYVSGDDTQSFFATTPSVATDSSGQDLGTKWSELSFIRTLVAHPLYDIADIVITRTGNGKGFVFDNSKLGLTNTELLKKLVDESFFTQAEADAYRALAVEKPYANKTQADWDALDAPEPVEQEVTYPSETYVLKSSTQALEFDVVINDGSTDNVFDVRLETCEVDQGHGDINNWFEVNNAFTPVRQGKGSRFKWLIESNSKRPKTYNKFFFTPRKACDFTVSVKAV